MTGFDNLSLDALRALKAMAVLAAYVALCAAILWRERARKLQAARDAAALLPAAGDARPLLVAHASQTGFAESLAWQTGRALHTAGVPVQVLSLGDVTHETLRQTERALFIVSTYGEGDPPDAAIPFVRRVMEGALTNPEAAPLSGLHHAVLALGDSEYAQFCGFGRRLDGWLRADGAQALFARIDVDKNDEAALAAWRAQLAHIAGTSDLPDWNAPAFEAWRLVGRQRLNPGSAGGPTYHLEFAPDGDQPLPQWEAGDLVQVLAPGDRERPREYSIASLPADGRLHLLVRQEQRSDGALGVASGWLTEQAELGSVIDMRLRAHGNFRLGNNAERPLILIGNGTGLAGLRGHLKARVHAADARNWLIFGERNAAHDFYYRHEIEAWQAQGLLAHADIVFSRDQPERHYVQDRLREQAARLRDWLKNGAAIYVCGSLQGMAAGVDAALEEILGADGVARLLESGRYRRDVY